VSTDLDAAVRSRLHAAVASIDPPTVEILQAVAQRLPDARRARRIRAAAASSVAAVAVTVLVAVLGPHHLGRAAPLASTPTGPSTPSSAVSTQCPGADSRAVHEPAHLAAVRAAFVCGFADDTHRDGSVWWVSTVSKVTGGLDRLLAAYALPDSPSPASNDGQRLVCAVPAYAPEVVWLDTTSGIVGIRVPVGPCQVPAPAAASAYQALTTVLVSKRAVSLISSPLAVLSGCPQRSKDLLEVGGRPATRGTPATITATSHVLACTYNAPDGADPSLTAGRTLTAPQVGALNAALAASVPDPTCSRQAGHRFVVISWGAQQALWVSLDGCAVLELNGRYWRATGGLRSLLN